MTNTAVMKDEVDVLKLISDELTTDKLVQLIEYRKSFRIDTVTDISFVVSKVEEEIEKQGLRCRVYTEYRAAAIAGVAIPTGITQLAGIATAIGVGAHNLATINPDYEVVKNKFAGTVTVFYKKG